MPYQRDFLINGCAIAGFQFIHFHSTRKVFVVSMSGLSIVYHKWELTLQVDLPFLSGFSEKTSEEKRIFSKMIVKIFMSTETFIFTSMCLGILKWKKYAMSNTALVYHNYFYCGIMITFTVIRLVLSIYFFLLSVLVFVSVSVSAFLFLSLNYLENNFRRLF